MDRSVLLKRTDALVLPSSATQVFLRGDEWDEVQVDFATAPFDSFGTVLFDSKGNLVVTPREATFSSHLSFFGGDLFRICWSNDSASLSLTWASFNWITSIKEGATLSTLLAKTSKGTEWNCKNSAINAWISSWLWFLSGHKLMNFVHDLGDTTKQFGHGTLNKMVWQVTLEAIFLIALLLEQFTPHKQNSFIHSQNQPF